MHLYFRLLWLLLSFKFKPKLVPPFETSRLCFRVLPNDLDTNLHLNNGRYLTLMDLGRVDLMLRGGLGKIIVKNGWLPMLSGAAIRYRREIRPFQKFHLESRIVYWSDKSFVMEQCFIIKDTNGRTIKAAKALVRGGIYSRKDRQFVEVAKLFEAIGFVGVSPEATADVTSFMATEDSLKRDTP